MNSANTYIIHPETTEQEDVLKAFFKAFKIKFKASDESPYNKDFVSKVLEAEEGIKNGKGKRVTPKEFDELWK